jgi:hypothetical protein
MTRRLTAPLPRGETKIPYSLPDCGGAQECCPGKNPGAVKTREHHPTVDQGASRTRAQVLSKIANRANALFITAARDNIPRLIAKVRLLRRQLEDTVAKDDQEGE